MSTITLADRVRHDLAVTARAEGVQIMTTVKLTARHVRYLLTTLAAIAFGVSMQ